MTPTKETLGKVPAAMTPDELDALVRGLLAGAFQVAVDGRYAGMPAAIKSGHARVYGARSFSPLDSVELTAEEILKLLAAGAFWVGPTYLDPRKRTRPQ